MTKTYHKVMMLGAGSLARDIIVRSNRHHFYRYSVAYVDAAFRTEETDCEGIPIASDWDQAVADSTYYVLGAADMKARALLRDRAEAAGLLPVPRMVDEYVCWSSSAQVGDGSVISNFVSLGSKAQVGQHVMAMQGVRIGHDNVIGDLCVLCSNVCIGGNARVGEGVFIGAGAVLAPGVTVGDGAVISAAGSFAIGNPARRVTREA